MARNSITQYTANGAIPAASGVAQLEKTTEGAYTLADPAADDAETPVTLELEILCNSAAKQEVTGNFLNGGNFTKLLFANGGFVRLVSSNGKWSVASANRGVTIL